MAIQQLNLAHENQLKPLKFQVYNRKENVIISFLAFLFSIFIFISVFYIFNLSPSSLLNTTKFWFFISNTLILIIAADFGASKKQLAEIPDGYFENSRANISVPAFESRYPEREIVKTSIPPHQKVKDLQETPEEVKEVAVADVACESKSTVNEMQVVIKDDVKESTEESQRKMPEFPPNVADEAHEEEKESETSRGNEPDGGEEEEEEVDEEQVEQEEENEFSKMSNEELNRRAEEFIQSFNRQIRIQAAQNRILQMQRGHFVHQTSLVK